MNTAHFFIHPMTQLKAFGLSPQKSWGQNFLVSEKAVKAICESCVPVDGTPVLEIGGGLGTLSHALVVYGAKLTIIENDPNMVRVLRSHFQVRPQVTVLHADAAEFDYRTWAEKNHGVVAGNLPYQITGAILKKVGRLHPLIDQAVFMVQKEVADRLMAPAGTKIRSALTVLMDANWKISKMLTLKPSAFFPPPKVQSSIIAMYPRTTPLVPEADQAQFVTVVKAAFSQKRKTIRNALLSNHMFEPAQVDQWLAAAGVAPTKRAEQLETPLFARLAKVSRDVAGKKMNPQEVHGP